MSNRKALMEKLRRLLPGAERLHTPFPFGLGALDSSLPAGGLAAGALHEVVPEAQAAMPAAFGFIVALLAHIFPSAPHHRLRPSPQRQRIVFVVPGHGLRQFGRPYGHGLRALGLDPAHLILVETAHRKQTLWAMEEALHSAAPAAVTGLVDKLDLKTSQRLHLAAVTAGLPLFLLRPAQNLESSAAATRWRVGTAEAARDRFGLITHPRWHLRLERARNGRPGEWVVEYDHVAHRFSLAAALADPADACRANQRSEERGKHAYCA